MAAETEDQDGGPDHSVDESTSHAAETVDDNETEDDPVEDDEDEEDENRHNGDKDPLQLLKTVAHQLEHRE